MAVATEQQLVKHIGEAYAMEKTILRMLDGMISRTRDEAMKAELESHRDETERHAERLEARLQAHGESPPRVKEAGGMLGVVMKGVMDTVRGEQPGRDARDGYVTEHMEIAAYELLKRVAQKAGDVETATACDEIIAQERAMAETIAQNWDKFAELSLREQGVNV